MNQILTDEEACSLSVDCIVCVAPRKSVGRTPAMTAKAARCNTSEHTLDGKNKTTQQYNTIGISHQNLIEKTRGANLSQMIGPNSRHSPKRSQ